MSQFAEMGHVVAGRRFPRSSQWAVKPEVDADRVDGRSDERRSPSLELRLANFDDECPIRHHGRIGAALQLRDPGRDQARQR